MKKEKLFSYSFSTCKMSQKVSQNCAVFVPEKCNVSQKNVQKVPEWPQKNMACMDTNLRHEKQSSLDSNFRIEPSTRIGIPQFEFKSADEGSTAHAVIKSWQRIAIKSFSQRLTGESFNHKFQSNLGTKSFSQKLTVKVLVKSWHRNLMQKLSARWRCDIVNK